MLVRDFMTSDPVTINPDTSHMEAVKLMRDQGIRRLPVLGKRGKLVGIVVEKDLLSTQPSPATTLSIWEIHSLLGKLQVKEFMTHPVYTARALCPIEDAARIMVEHKIGCLPIMDGDKLVGIITETDIFKALTQMLSGGEPGTRMTIRLQRQRGVIAQLAQAITGANGLITSLATLNEPDGEHKKVAVKIANTTPEALQQAMTAHTDWQITDMRESGDCHRPGVFGKD